MSAIRTGVLMLAMGLSSSAASYADPIRIITGGNVDTGNYDTGFALAGANFTFMASQQLEPLVNCQPCTPGAAFNLSATLMVRDWPAGRATLDGNTYDPVFYSGQFDFDGGSVVVPDIPPGQSGPDGQGLTRLFTTFTFTGTLQGFADPSLTGSPLFSAELSGGGLARASFSNYPSASGIRVLQLDYQFENAATPEPGSLLLFGPGAAWLVARWRKRSTAAQLTGVATRTELQ